MKISFWSYKGGTGRTIALANVAVELVRRGRNVGMVDLDLDAPGLYLLFGKDREEINKRGHLIDILQSKSIGIISSLIMDITLPGSFQSSKGRLYLLPSINTPTLDRLKFDDEMFIFMSQVTDEFIKIFRLDYLLIDTRTGFSIFSGLGHFLSKLIIVTFRPDLQDTEGVKEAIKTFEYHSQNFKLVCTPVPNLPEKSERLKKAERLLEKKISVCVDLEPRLLLEEELLIVTNPTSPASESYRKIADHIEGVEND